MTVFPDPSGDASIRALLVMSALYFLSSTVLYVWTLNPVAPIPRDGTSLVVGRDFLNFWMYGRAATSADPGRFYDPVLYNAELLALLGQDYLGQNWSYPPSIMLLAAPFGRLPYLVALLTFTALGMALFIFAARRHLSDRGLLFPLLFSPASLFCLVSGQLSFLITAVLVGIFVSLDRRPIFAGVLVGLLSLKPQVGLLFPVLLVASARWRVFLVASLTALALVALTTVLFGSSIWTEYFAKAVPVQHTVLADSRLLAAPFMPTVFMNMRLAGASYPLAMAVQACSTLFAVAVVFWASRFRADADPRVTMALFFTCSILAVPYLLAYDTLPLTLSVVALFATDKLDAKGSRIAMLAYWLPAVQMALGTLHIPGAALIPMAFAAYLLVRLRGQQTALPRSGGVPA
jgi:hypothetical protein